MPLSSSRKRKRLGTLKHLGIQQPEPIRVGSLSHRNSRGLDIMRGKRRAGALGAMVLLVGVAIAWRMTDSKEQEQTRESATKAYNAGNYKDAYQVLHKLALDPKDDPVQVGKDLDLAVQCQRHLGNVDEIDDFREAVIAAHARNWRLLQTAALSYANVDHYGYIVAGKFYRGHKRGGGRWVNTFERDRTRALQLMQQALPLAE